MAISSPGIGSGLDVSTIITQLMTIERQPLEQLETAESKIRTQISEVGKIKSALSKFRDLAAKLSSADFWKQTAGTASNSAVTITTSSSASAADYTVEVGKLAAAQTIAAPAVASSSATLGSGTLTIASADGSDPVDVTIEATDTLAAIRDKINAAGSSVTASILNDASGARLMLRSNATGEDNAFSTTVSGTGLGGLTFDHLSATGGATLAQAASNAEATINNLPVTSSTNSLTDVLDGVSLTLNAETAAPMTLSVKPDSAAIKKTLQDFAAAYTELAKLIGTDTRYDATSKKAGVLQGDSAIVGLQTQLRAMLGATSGASATFPRLSDAGFEMQQDGSLTVNASKLDKAIANLPELKKMFSTVDTVNTNNQGFAWRLRDFASSVLGIDGSLTSRTDGLNEKLERNTDAQERFEDRLARTQKRLEAQYSALDARLGTLNSLSTYVTQQIAQWNKA